MAPMPHRCSAQVGSVAREAAEQLMNATARYFGKTTAREAASELAEYGGEAVVRRAASRLAAEGGEAAVSRAVRLTQQHGPNVVRALDNAPSGQAAVRVFDALDELPGDQAAAAVRQLASSRTGRELFELVERHGAAALRTAATHPGAGTRLVRYLGDDGIRLGQKLTTEQATVIARRADEIAKLPPKQRQELSELIYKDTERVVQFIGEFTKKNPGKTLFTASVTTIILANPERVLGGDEIVIGPDGKPVLVSKPGLIGRTTETVTEEVARPVMDGVIMPLSRIVVFAVGVFAIGWLGIRLWAVYRHTAARLPPSRRLSPRHASSIPTKPTSPRSPSRSTAVDDENNR
ncbi:MAG: hypothetical protein KatS3mg111_3930 [Pirellulaceae bacterium]|nr:MAG: hypothetical protein KatS3mg111_3930 [Pirellulaceae bacterium]